MSKLLKASTYVDQALPQLVAQVAQLKSRGLHPKMQVLLVGDNPASLVYIEQKKKYCEKIGAAFELTHLPKDTSEDSLLSMIKKINEDKTVTGFLIQQPVPAHLQHLPIADLVDPKKDVDGFHFLNTKDIYQNKIKSNTLIPCTPKGIVTLLNFYHIDVANKHIVVIGRSLIVGKPLSLYLNTLNATVTMAHSKTHELEKLSRIADIIIVACGSPGLLKKSHLSTNMDQIIIDVGLSKVDGKIAGDVSPEVYDHVAAYTPVPGGVGPMTVISLIENLIIATQNQGNL